MKNLQKILLCDINRNIEWKSFQVVEVYIPPVMQTTTVKAFGLSKRPTHAQVLTKNRKQLIAQKCTIRFYRSIYFVWSCTNFASNDSKA